MRIIKATAILAILASALSCQGNWNKRGEDANQATAKDNDALVLQHLNVDRQEVMRYVTCKEQTIDTLLAIGDTAYSYTDSLTLESLGLDSEEYNKQLIKQYADTIPLIAAVFLSYDMMTSHTTDEATATFTWHEVARQQMRHFYESKGMKWNEEKDTEAIFHIIDEILSCYGGGSQGDLSNVAWRQIMPTDYRLIGSYKRLIRAYKDREVVSLALDDYRHIMQAFREQQEAYYGYYSDFPRQQGVLLNWTMEAKRRNITQMADGHYSAESVKKNLREHRCIVGEGKGKSIVLTADYLLYLKNEDVPELYR